MLDYVWDDFKNKNVNIKKNSAKIKVYLVFIEIFNFFRGRFELAHALFHSCLPFPDF
jgi:hypothetical protein